MLMNDRNKTACANFSHFSNFYEKIKQYLKIFLFQALRMTEFSLSIDLLCVDYAYKIAYQTCTCVKFSQKNSTLTLISYDTI